MKKKYILFLSFLFLLNSGSSQVIPVFFWKKRLHIPFKTLWKTDNPGASSSTQIKLPLLNGATYNFKVKWGDGTSNTITTYNDPLATHTYSSAGTYTVSITGVMTHWKFANIGDKEKIIDVIQWGKIKWGTMNSMFYGCLNLVVSATDAPDLSGVIDMSRMFFDAESFNSPIDHWDVSNVESMISLFREAILFNQDLNSWDTSKVSQLNSIFFRANKFNGNISSWNTSNVTNLYRMANSADDFNSDISSWDTSKLEGLNLAFKNATSFNQDLSGWDTSSITNSTDYDSGATAWSAGNKPIF